MCWVVRKKDWRISADALEEVVDIVDNISYKEYQKYVESVGKVDFLIENGYFTKKVLNEAAFYM